MRSSHAQPAAVPYFDITRQYKKLHKEFEKALTVSAASGQYILSQQVLDFENAFARYCGAGYGIGVASGTDALIFALRAAGVGEGDEVIAPSYTFSASIFAILHAGATPVLVDVESETCTIDPKEAETAVTKKTKAILPVHLYGQCADMGAVEALAKKKKLQIVEDACQAHGAEWKKRKAGSFGTGCFSFYPTKNLGAMGDGGIITSSNAALKDTFLRLRNLGRKDMSEGHEIPGFTSRLDALQAAILNIKLNHLDDLNNQRRWAADTYQKELAGTPLVMPAEAKDRRHVYHLFTVRVPGGKRDKLQAFLAEAGIRTMVHYSTPAHRQPACKGKVRIAGKLLATEALCGEVLCLPMFPEITGEEIGRVAEAIKKFYA